MNGPDPVGIDSPRPAVIPGLDGQPAFSLHLPDEPPPVLIAVPHAGRYYPPALTARMRLPRVAKLRLEDRLVDLVAHAVARETGAALLVAHAPRAMIDLNRGPADMDWDMVTGLPPGERPIQPSSTRARGGLGLIPRRLSGTGEIWRGPLPAGEVEARLEMVHRPYHQALSETLAKLRKQWGAALLLDLHSMPPLPVREDGGRTLCVIGDRFRAAAGAELSAAAISHLQDAGYRTAHNRPYAGGYVLDRHGQPTRGIHALQLELCRSLYLDENLREPGPGLTAITTVIAGLIRRLAAELASVPEQRLAAE
ncbi:N-formylglutamate amidohydrolase [Croceibacterium sp. TMG7-5b_MA50]|uniref:N-formylglutamate amidohydrolase n=1 Tax=Croceibacterium sp. TMG7-5b_MA50 TaxID=3121290 RepID=UPI0032216FAA